MKKFLLILLILISNILFVDKIKASDYFDFNGYIQLRGISDFNDYTSFSVRRLKFRILFGFNNTIMEYYRIAYNYLINKGKIKLSLDYYFQIIENKFRNYYLSIQFQMFLKQ